MKDAFLILFFFLPGFAALQLLMSVQSCNAQGNLQDSIRTIHNQTEDRETIESRQANAHAQDEIKTGQTLGREIINEAEGEAATARAYGAGRNYRPRAWGWANSRWGSYSMSGFGWGGYRWRGYTWASALSNQLRQQARIQANSLNQLYKEKANADKAGALHKERSLEDSALGLEEQLVGSAEQDGTHLNPVGTNLYVRNYVVSPPRPIMELVANQKQLEVPPRHGHFYIKTDVSGKLVSP